jgi:hypothetical protein
VAARREVAERVWGVLQQRLVVKRIDRTCGEDPLRHLGRDAGRTRDAVCGTEPTAFSPDEHQMTISMFPGVGPDGNADLWIGQFDSTEHIDSLAPLTRTDLWESSVRWGTAPLIH